VKSWWVPVDCVALWRQAARLEPTRPWIAVSRELSINEALAQRAYRAKLVPPGLNPAAAARFLTLAVPAAG
jgi:hypothetical protein